MKTIQAEPEFLAKVRHIRRDLHAHPELGYEEERTSHLVASKLAEWGIPVTRDIGVTGLVGVIKKGKSHRAIGLRADMDALPIQESNRFEHASRHVGKMHACGHDGHTAMLLGAAYYLLTQGEFDGTVVLIFQPAEEGGGGAKKMMDDGLFDQFPVQAVFGMHNYPGMAVGNFAVTPGPMLASASEFVVTIGGKGAHAAQPQQGIDSLMVAVQLAQSWQSIITRSINPVDSAVLSITQFHAGDADNVIPDEAIMRGTVRTFSPTVLDMIEARMRQIAEHTAAAFGATMEFRFERNYPPLVNSIEETALAVEVMRGIVGEDRVDACCQPVLAAEDFAFMLQKLPGSYVHIGNGGHDHRASGHGLGPCNLHNPSYDFNDEALLLGMTYWVKLAETYLKGS